MPDYYDKAGRPITADEFVRLKWDGSGTVSDYSRVGRDQVGDAEVSTVWLGLDHAFPGMSAPLIFETLIFGGEHDGMQYRYRSEGEALRGHRRAVNNLRRGREPFADNESGDEDE